MDIELAVCEGLDRARRNTRRKYATHSEKANFDPQRIDEIEETTRHDVIAFTSCVAEYVGEDSRFIHRGLTSYDVVDTALSLLLKEAGQIIRNDLQDLLDALKARASSIALLPLWTISRNSCRTNDVWRQTSLFHSEMARHLKRWDAALDGISVGKISGAVGSTHIWIPRWRRNT